MGSCACTGKEEREARAQQDMIAMDIMTDQEAAADAAADAAAAAAAEVDVDFPSPIRRRRRRQEKEEADDESVPEEAEPPRAASAARVVVRQSRRRAERPSDRASVVVYIRDAIAGGRQDAALAAYTALSADDQREVACMHADHHVHRTHTTLVHWAAQQGMLELLGAFLESGIDRVPLDRFGETAIHAAARGGSYDAVQMLYDIGMNPRVRSRFGASARQVALQKARQAHLYGLTADKVNALYDVADLLRELERAWID